jgi:hypothetical protein
VAGQSLACTADHSKSKAISPSKNGPTFRTSALQMLREVVAAASVGRVGKFVTCSIW